MPLTPKVLLTVVLISVAAVAAPSSAATPVEVWRGGDDGLTLRFADALERVFRKASEFSLSSGKVPGTLIITIPSNVSWKRVGHSTQVTYSVEFTGTAGQPLGMSDGKCDENRLQECAAHVLRDARAVRVTIKP